MDLQKLTGRFLGHWPRGYREDLYCINQLLTQNYIYNKIETRAVLADFWSMDFTDWGMNF